MASGDNAFLSIEGALLGRADRGSCLVAALRVSVVGVGMSVSEPAML